MGHIQNMGDWRRGSAVDLHSIGHWFESSITHLASMVESVDTPDLKSVAYCRRGSSSLPTRTQGKEFAPLLVKSLCENRY